MLRIFLVFLLSTTLLFCNSDSSSQQINDNKGLKDYYLNYFPVGVSVGVKDLGDSSIKRLIEKHFNSLTAENAMKMRVIQPEENKFYWKDADSIANYARQKGFRLRGHTLLWPREIPEWFFKGENGKQADKELVYERLKNHITTVMKRYSDVVSEWDVVNEVISDDKNEFYRPSKILDICGEDYIFKAFEFARMADSNAKLIYNDYNVYMPQKRQKIIELIKKMKQKNVPLDGFGIQAHWSSYEPSEQGLKDLFNDFSSLQIPLYITELDVSIYPRTATSDSEKKLQADTVLTNERVKKQIHQYEMIFKYFRLNKHLIKGLTFWNIYDGNSWLNNFPVKNRKDYPLLFDRNKKEKEALKKVIFF